MFHRLAPWWSCHRGVYCLLPSEVSPEAYILSSTRHVFSMSRQWRSSLHTIDPLGQFFLFPVALKCWCGTIATMFSQAPRTRHSRPWLFFPRGCIFSTVKTIVCCLCHLLRVTFTKAVGKVAKIARCCPPELTRCCATHFGSL